MAAQSYTKKTFIERIKRDMANGFPDSEFSFSDNEVLFHIDQAVAFAMVGQVYNLAKLEGTITTPEAYVSRFSITSISKNESTGEWYATLPQPPVSLPLGYSVTNVFFGDTVNGKSDPVLPIENKRVSFRDFMPFPKGSRYYVVGSTIYLQDFSGSSMRDRTLYVEMVKSRTTDINEAMEMPDDAIQTAYTMVMDVLRKRTMNPQDIIKDNLPSGNKQS